MIKTLNIILRLVIWFLLTASFSATNIALGIAVARLLPHSRESASALKDWLRVLWDVIVAIPQAYIEAFELIFRPHNYEAIAPERIKPGRFSSKHGTPTAGLIFLDIFLITFTPKTIVLKCHKSGWYEVHRVQRRPVNRANAQPTISGDFEEY